MLTVPEAAERLSVSRSTLCTLIDGGRLKRVKIGRSALVKAAALAQFVEQFEDA
ncbi:helix-turn-helix domain-containing protein [Luteimicrobium album]|uniref:helix-turn-helix domain-containing protein n=1 Tax=Luteimicrobium album TaxID=1054550 RepID=UPI003D66B1A1